MKHSISVVNEVQQRILGMLMDRFRRPGDKLPSIRSLAAKAGCSPMTVFHAVQRLVAAGFLETRPKSGLYIAHQPESCPDLKKSSFLNTLYFFYYPSAIQVDTYHADILRSLSKEAQWKRWNFYLGDLGDQAELRQAFADPDAVGIVLQANPQKVLLNLDSVERTSPLVAYGVGPSPDALSVSLDNYQGGWTLAEHLMEHDRKNIVFIVPNEKNTDGLKNRAYLERLHGVEDCLRFREMFLEKILPWSVDGMTEPVLSFLLELRKKNDHPVLIVTNCAMAKEIYLLAKTMGFHIPEDFGIASFIRRNVEECKIPITCMDFSHEDMAKAIFQLILISDRLESRFNVTLEMTLQDCVSI